MSSPILFKNLCIGSAAVIGLAVNINTFSLPNFLLRAIAFSNIGPLAPLVTTSNSLKSNSAPWSVSSLALLANSVAFKAPSVPSGKLYKTFDFVVASVSSKSQTLIPFVVASAFLAISNASSSVLKSFICILLSTALLYFNPTGCNLLLDIDALLIVGAILENSFIRALACLAVISPINCWYISSPCFFITSKLFCKFLGTLTLYLSASVMPSLVLILGFKVRNSLYFLISDGGTLLKSPVLKALSNACFKKGCSSDLAFQPLYLPSTISCVSLLVTSW